jgi:hypothetical protein
VLTEKVSAESSSMNLEKRLLNMKILEFILATFAGRIVLFLLIVLALWIFH